MSKAMLRLLANKQPNAAPPAVSAPIETQYEKALRLVAELNKCLEQANVANMGAELREIVGRAQNVTTQVDGSIYTAYWYVLRDIESHLAELRCAVIRASQSDTTVSVRMPASRQTYDEDDIPF